MKHVIRPCARDDIIRQFRWYLIEQDASEMFLDVTKDVSSDLLLLVRPLVDAFIDRLHHTLPKCG